MINLLILFTVVFLVGLGFWYYNRRQIQTLSETISDKDAVITALKQHYIGEENPNDNWRGGGAFTYETVELSTSKPVENKPRKSKVRTSKSNTVNPIDNYPRTTKKQPATIKPKRTTKSRG